MRNCIKYTLGLLGVLGVALTSIAHAQETPIKGGTLNMILQPEPPTLMLGLNTQGPTIFAGGQIYQSLLSYTKDLAPEPSLAKSWLVSGDGLTYTFTLQDNVRWHDGKPFTADDVVFTADKFLRKSHPRWRYIANTYIETITASAANQVVFKLKKPFSAFLYAFEISSFPVVPKHIYDGTDYASNAANQTPIGTGPFKFKEWQRGSYVHLVKNENYWKPGKPLLDDIYFRVIPDSASRAVAFEQGTVDVLRGGDVEGFEVRRLSKLENVDTTTNGWEMYSPLSFMIMNLRKAPFDNKLVRQAVMHAIDRNFIAKAVFFGQGIPATGPLASTTQFYTENTSTYPFDIEQAKALIAESGVNVAAEPIRLMPMPYGSHWDRLAEYMKEQLEQIGFKVTIQSVDAGGWSQALSDWNFDISFNFTYQYGHPALGVARHYLSANIIKGTPFANNEGYSNPKVDELLAEGASAVKSEDAEAAYAEMQKITTDDVALGWLIEIKNTTISKSKVKGLVRSAIGLNEALEEAWIAK